MNKIKKDDAANVKGGQNNKRTTGSSIKPIMNYRIALESKQTAEDSINANNKLNFKIEENDISLK